MASGSSLLAWVQPYWINIFRPRTFITSSIIYLSTASFCPGNSPHPWENRNQSNYNPDRTHKENQITPNSDLLIWIRHTSEVFMSKTVIQCWLLHSRQAGKCLIWNTLTRWRKRRELMVTIIIISWASMNTVCDSKSWHREYAYRHTRMKVDFLNQILQKQYLLHSCCTFTNEQFLKLIITKWSKQYFKTNSAWNHNPWSVCKYPESFAPVQVRHIYFQSVLIQCHKSHLQNVENILGFLLHPHNLHLPQ